MKKTRGSGRKKGGASEMLRRLRHAGPAGGASEGDGDAAALRFFAHSPSRSTRLMPILIRPDRLCPACRAISSSRCNRSSARTTVTCVLAAAGRRLPEGARIRTQTV